LFYYFILLVKMGNFCTCSDDPHAVQEHNKLEKQLAGYKKIDNSTKRLLLLGPGNSGKSTFLKQLLIIAGSGFSDEQLMDFTRSIFECILAQMKMILRQCRILNFELASNVEQSAEFIENLKFVESITPKEFANHITTLWNDQNIKDSFVQRTHEGIADSAPYFFEQINRLAVENYKPTEQDVLLMRVPTAGVIETNLTINEVNFKIFDVGGQRSERGKWIHYFDLVTAILFVASLSCYDQSLFEMGNVNAMNESLQLFSEVINSKWFRNASMILFLNKSDLFETKLKKRNLSVCFSDYDGNNSFKDALDFVRRKFVDQNQNKKVVNIFCHVTCATDCQNVKVVFRDVQQTIINESLRRGGLI